MMPPLCCTRFILSFACSLVPYQCQYEDATVESDAIIGTHQNVTFRDSHGTKHILICWSMFCNLPRRWMCRDQRRWIYLKVGIYKNYIFMSTLIFPYCKRWVSLCLASNSLSTMPKLKATIANNKELGGRIVMHPCYVFSFFVRQTPPNCNYSTLYGEVRFTLSLAILGYLSPCTWPWTFSLAPIWTALRDWSRLQVMVLGMRFWCEMEF